MRTNGTVGIEARARARAQAQTPLSPLHTLSHTQHVSLAPARNVPPGTNYWKGFEIKTVCRDDFSPLEKRFCNFGVAYSEVPNFTWAEGEKVGLWHLKNRHHDPEFKPPTIEFHPETNGAPDDPFSTFSAIPGGWAHFINAKAHSDRTKPDINKYVQFTMLHTLNRNHYKTPIKFFYTDPNQHHEQWNDEPTQPKIAELDTNSDPKDDTERRKGIGANDNVSSAGGFLNENYGDDYNEAKLEITPYSFPSGSSLYFRTNNQGGDNFIPKAYFITPACFQWGRLGQPDTDESVTVWRKYPLFISQLYHKKAIDFNYKVFDDKMAKNVKSAYDDNFTLVFPEPEKYLFVRIPEEMKFLNKIPIYNEYFWASEISNIFCQFHQRSSPDYVHNLHIILYPFATGNPDEGGFSNFLNLNWADEPIAVLSMDATKKKWQTLFTPYLTHNVIHEIGHLIGHLSHEPKSFSKDPTTYTYNDVSVMNYYEAYIDSNDSDNYPYVSSFDELQLPDGTTFKPRNPHDQPVYTFNLRHSELLREGSQEPKFPGKWPFFYLRRDKP